MSYSSDTKRDAGGRANRLFIKANAAWDKGDLATAFALFRESAELGDKGSQVDLGYFFDRGLFVRRDRRKAIKWYHRAYRQGDPGGANNIATVYKQAGEKKKMFWWFRRAAEMGDSEVQLDLARRYEKGLALPRNPKKAHLLYRCVLANSNASAEEKLVAARRTEVLEKQLSRARQ